MREAWRRQCREDLLSWCIEALAVYGQTPALHHQLLITQLTRIARGEIDRLMVFMPPRHAKSMYTSKLFIPWFLQQDPTRSIIAGSHTYDLAEGFGRFVRNLVIRHQGMLTYSLQQDSQAAGHWLTDKGGGYLAAGVGKAIAGNPGDLLIIDDPVANREAAESEQQRNKVWDWYLNDLYTRQQPGCKIILIQCMVGDTAVTMADGRARPLREIRLGDRVATYDNGRLGTSTILGWKNQGQDAVFEITMASGAKVKANRRHPFLVKRGEAVAWIPLGDLRPGDKIVRQRVRIYGDAHQTQS